MKKLLLLMIMLFLVGCDGNVNEDISDNPASEDAVIYETTDILASEDFNPLGALHAALERFPSYVTNDNTPIEGGTLRVALASNTPFTGVFASVFYTQFMDLQLMQWWGGSCPVLSVRPDNRFGQNGIASFTYDVEAQTVTLTMQEEVFWHDDVPLTLDDLVFALEVIGHPDYIGARFNAMNRNIVGMEEYHRGEADTISGLTLSEDKRELVMEFINFQPTILYNGFWAIPFPRHHFEGIEVADMAASPQARANPLGWGPFKVSRVVPGESVELVRNDNFYLGPPKLDRVVISVAAESLLPMAMEQGLYHIAYIFPADLFADHSTPQNFSYIGTLSGRYYYTAFRLGTFDTELNRVVHDPDAKMANVYLRRAMAYAINEDLLANHLFSGLRFSANSILAPRHQNFLNTEIPGFYYDPQKARDILDAAGFIDIDADGFRKTPDGEELTINFAMAAGANDSIISQFYIQAWEDIGLRVVLYQGRHHETGALSDAMRFDRWPDVDVVRGAWTAGYNPVPVGMWGHSNGNFARYLPPDLDAALESLTSDAAWDAVYLKDAFNEFQRLFNYHVPAFTNNWTINLHAVSNSVINYAIDLRDGIRNGGFLAFHLIQLSE